MTIKSGYGNGTLPLWAVFNLYVIFIITSIPGLAISPIMGDLTRIFPGTTPLETQLLEIGPNIAAIPFVFLGGWIGTKFNNSKLSTWTCLLYGLSGVAFFFVKSMLMLIVLSFLIGIFAGILSPLSTAFIADMFGGKERSKQYGATSATLNLVLMGCVIATGYLAKINWHLPFIIYLLPLVPLFFAKGFKKYITEPSAIRQGDAHSLGVKKVHYKFSKEVNVPMLVRYCIYYFVITFVIAAISLYIPFRYTNSSTAGDLTAILFFGIMLSGYTLNWFLRYVKKGIAIIVMAAIAVGFLMISITSEVVIVGIGILIATYFYGIAQPYYYNKLSVASSRVALTLTLAWFASMDSIGNVVAAPCIDLIAKLFHKSTNTDPNLAFWICTGIAIVSLVIVIIRGIIVKIHAHEEPAMQGAAPAAATASATAAAPAKAAAVSTVPADPGASVAPLPDKPSAFSKTLDTVKANDLISEASKLENEAQTFVKRADSLLKEEQQKDTDATPKPDAGNDKPAANQPDK